MDMKRAVSTTYYAIFHHLCGKTCDLICDPTLGRARQQVYRSIDHGLAKASCIEAKAPGKSFPVSIQRYAETFLVLQQKRHDADYDPVVAFEFNAVHDLIAECEAAMQGFDAEDERHRLAFVLLVALKRRGR